MKTVLVRSRTFTAVPKTLLCCLRVRFGGVPSAWALGRLLLRRPFCPRIAQLFQTSSTSEVAALFTSLSLTAGAHFKRTLPLL